MENKTILQMRDISIEFPGVKALSNVNLDIRTGETRALVGANGAGKSTLMKVLAGVNTHYTGQIFIDENPVRISSPKVAKELGIQIVFQEVDTALIPYLTVAENVMFNSIVNSMGKKQLINWRYIHKTAAEELQRLNINLDVSKLVSDLTLAQKQMVLIARCIVEKCRFLILDEPTAPLSNKETENLFEVVRNLVRTDNVGVVFISHRLNELYEICDNISVMRDGENVVDLPLTRELKPNEIVEYMLGRKFEEEFPKQSVNIGDVLLQVENLTEKHDKIRDITMHVNRGEIVGIVGLVGAGKTELCKTLFGALRTKSGSICLNGKKLKIKSPSGAVKEGIALVPEERRKEGILVNESVYANISIAAINKYTGLLGIVHKKDEKKDSVKMIKDLGIKTPSENQKVALLSGGNQQKVAVGKWLNCESELYIFDEPTKGVDVGAKHDIFTLIERVAKDGKGVIYASCEFQEVLSIADRCYVMYDGMLVKELNIKDTNEKELLYYSTGGH